MVKVLGLMHTSNAHCYADQCGVVCCREGSPKTKAEQDAAAKAALEAFHLCPNLEILVPALLEGGPGELQRRCSLTPGGDVLICVVVLVVVTAGGGAWEAAASPQVKKCLTADAPVNHTQTKSGRSEPSWLLTCLLHNDGCCSRCARN
jgi:hypothetical protein